MNLNKVLMLMIAALSCFVASCAKSEPPVAAVEYTQVCNAANKGKTIAVQGFLGFGNKTPCVTLMRGDMKRDCGFKLLDKVNVVGKEIIVYLREGKENNQAETPETGGENVKPSAGFENEQVKFRLNDGTVVAAQKDVATPVTVTGEVSMSSDSDKECSILANKIEKR
jgi:hypothetical protein